MLRATRGVIVVYGLEEDRLFGALSDGELKLIRPLKLDIKTLKGRD